MPRPSEQYYRDLPARIGAALTPEKVRGGRVGVGGGAWGGCPAAHLALPSQSSCRFNATCLHPSINATRLHPCLPACAQYAEVEELGLLVDKDDQGVLLQVGAAGCRQRRAALPLSMPLCSADQWRCLSVCVLRRTPFSAD